MPDLGLGLSVSFPSRRLTDTSPAQGAFAFLLEEGPYGFLLEDGTSFWLLES